MFGKIRKQAEEELRRSGMTDAQVQQISSEIDAGLAAVDPPRVALIGFTGVGKSSTINALFNAGQPIGHVRACTQEAREVRGEVSEYLGRNGSVIVYDMPGLGEDISADQKHLETYAAVLPRVDVAMWTFHAGDRAMTPMQSAILTLQRHLGPDFASKLVFAVNKADAIAPGEMAWMTKFNLPRRAANSSR